MKFFCGKFIHCPLICNTFRELFQLFNKCLPGDKKQTGNWNLEGEITDFYKQKN